MTAALVATGLGKRYGSRWALQDCTLSIQPGQVVALVGPNGAGKSTFLEMATGLLRPSAGTIEVAGAVPWDRPSEALPAIGFVAQDHPLYRNFTVEELLWFGRALNANWDHGFAHARVASLGLPLKKKAGQLSGGQQAQVALVLALAKRPQVLLLDEPIAAFDPLARREFLQVLMETVATTGATVVLSSHILGDLERVCDSLVVLSNSRVRLTGAIDEVLARHRFVVGPAEQAALACQIQAVVQMRKGERQVGALIRLETPLVLADGWTASEPSLEDIVLGYLQRDATTETLAEEVAV
jgi:ABC-type multidrug transport system ATPase subunit